MKAIHKSCLTMQLCHFLPLPLVRPLLKLDVQLLDNNFVNGYHESDIVLYVSIMVYVSNMEDKGRMHEITQSIYDE